LRGKGVPHPSGGPAGDFYVVIKIVVPKDLDDAASRQLAEIVADKPVDLRGALKDDA
jgi:DnaJ-class molecular chaperone